MEDPLSLRALPSWFVVLPDTDAAAAVAAAALAHGAQALPHRSGRPWLVGRWAPPSIVVGDCRGTRVAVLGEHSVTPEAARRAAEAAEESSLSALDRVSARWAGSLHLVASRSGRVRVRGGVVGMRRVFFTDAALPAAGGVSLASDRADVLAELAGAELDDRRLALELLTPGVPHPLSGSPMWRGVHAVPGGHHLTLDSDGRAGKARWWSPPDPHLPLAEGAVRFREALTTAVATRTRGRALVTADLGGLDSTAVCCAAAGGDAKVAAYTAAIHDELGDDAYWARRTTEALGTVEHHVVPASELAMTFDGIDTLDDLLDTPSILTVDRNRRMHIIALAAARGSSLHLTGLGGDELLAGTPARLHALMARHPLTALRDLRGYTAKYQWSRWHVLRQLMDRRSYRAWLARVVRDLDAPPAPPGGPLLDWSAPPRMPGWATPEAVEAVRELLRAHLPEAEPRGRGHGEHQEIAGMDGISQWTRHIGQMAAPLGVTVAAPYYDDRVIEAALAVRPQERITPWRYKPLIVEAMRGVVPEASRARGTKANATFEEEEGLRRHRAALLALCEESRLARMGLVDVEALREWCLGPLSAETGSYLLHPTVACEVWLRSRETAPPRTRP
ncbi:lasso peptide isopeptide bond-forming cyclase [Streptomyces sp. fd1-xmd]|uniref:lasso peptide isopeptide bond-forming cyclase n=1 Tax=Streptomyces sp. fd1-xmd TaxID=1812480 RepID=UPI0009903833|nr:lasso peptide isopeptide bond-forming cyclase [Streptomyces sp. fd1-xmd]AQT70521.1 asparagine synthase [Streptomyces sp. fd1-xmd]